MNMSPVGLKRVSTVPRLIAFYLPQFHPVPENDEWWGKGFTEWTNVTRAKPLYKGHIQPNLPGELGFYDLRVSEVREEQARLARNHGIEGFCYWHYWFGNGKKILERPFDEVRNSGRPDYPFCLGWANESWSGIWHGLQNKILIEQTYPGIEDYRMHFRELESAFHDTRQLCVDGKPIFVVYLPERLPNAREFTDTWNEMAVRSGFSGIYFIGIFEDLSVKPQDYGFNGKSGHFPGSALGVGRSPPRHRFRRKVPQPTIFDYAEYVVNAENLFSSIDDFIPCVVPNWDNTPRSDHRGIVLAGATIELYKRQLTSAIEAVSDRPSEEQIVLLKSWNEWAEGNYLEPDQLNGRRLLEATLEVVNMVSGEVKDA